jgi:hypothetical protein
MSEIRTGGAPITAATTIAVTHAYHEISGNGGIANIVPPEGFSGMILLRATGAWNLATTGTGRGKIGTPLTMTPGKVAMGWYDGGSDTWWFTTPAT